MFLFLKDERGSILPIMAAVLAIVLAISAVAIDFARRGIAAEKLQTAGDAASVAAAMSATRYVRLEIDPGSYETVCCGEDDCWVCCIDCGDPFEIVGTEKELIDEDGYQDYCCSCGCGTVKLLDRWVEYEGNNAQYAALMFFNLNKPREMSAAEGGDSAITDITVYGNRNNPKYPSVVVETTGRVKTILLNSLNKLFPGADFTFLGASRCSQGGSFYYDLDGRWHRAAAEGCD
jgi:hypothetical protein